MALVERTAIRKGSILSLLLGRVLPHTAIAGMLLYFLTERIATLHEHIWLIVGVYALLTFAHSYAAYKRIRFRYVALLSALAGVATWIVIQAMSFATEAGGFYVAFLASFIIALLIFSAVNNFFFIWSRFWYFAELIVLNAVWLIVIVTGIEAPIEEAIGLSLPLVAYSLYILLFDYAFMQPLHSRDKTKLFFKYAAVVLILILASLFGFLSGISKSQKELTRSYSLMSSQGGLYVMDDRARMEEDFRIPLDSKELVFIANIDPTLLYGTREYIGYYLKFHSLYNYDPQSAEFNSRSDEMEDPYFYLRQVDITSEPATPRHLTVDLAGNNIVPPYSLRSEGAATIYNVKLDTKQSFANNLTYRFIAYPATDSVMVGEKVLPVLGVYRLFNRISMLNIIPVGTSGQFFDFDYNRAILDRAEEYYNPDAVPRSFVQQYLNYSGLEQDIVDTVRALVRGKQTMGERVRAISDFFTQRDDLGNPVFTYDIHPGKSPDPNETMLHYFLMKNRRGYCTYYATAAALFFRVAGIPARVAIGFVPGETSKKNPGWYYVYSQQGHAWTEIYLGPNLGWLDVDVTPGGDSELAPPPPDPSPPKPPIPPKPVYALRGVVTETNPLNIVPKSLTKRSEQEDIPMCAAFTVPEVLCEYDSSFGNKERAAAVLATVQVGDTVIATGREELNPDAALCAFDRFTWYTLKRIEKHKRDSLAAVENGGSKNPLNFPWWVYAVVGGLAVLFIHSIPSIHLWRLRRKAVTMQDDVQRLFVLRNWFMMMFHINGYPSGVETDTEYALRLSYEPGADVRGFFDAYHRARYYGAAGSASRDVAERTIAETFRALQKDRNILQRFWARIHLWEYFRIINRRKTA